MLPKTYSQTKRKIFNLWNSEIENRVKIDVEINQNNLIINELNRSKISNQVFNKITDISFEWDNMYLIYNEDDEQTEKAFLSWEVTFNNMKIEQISSMKHSFNFRFGSSGSVDSEILEDTTILSTNYIQSSKYNNDENTLTFYFGIYLSDTSGLEEVDEKGIQARLNLTLINPNLYYN